MSFVDRSGTNWTPWPRLAGIPHRLQVIGGVAAIMGAAALMHQYRQIVGAPKPTTMTKEWQEATDKMEHAKETESNAPPVVLNPITKALQKK